MNSGLKQAMGQSNITIAVVDDVDPATSALLMQRLSGLSDWGALKLFTSKEVLPPPGVVVVKVDPITSIGAYCSFVITQLVNHITTDYVLVCQRDGYVINMAAWRDSFLEYDYIGAPWDEKLVQDEAKKRGLGPQPRGCLVGNGGFSLRSRKLLVAGALLATEGGTLNPEDTFICVTNRSRLESMGFKFAPVETAALFSVENAPYANQFGFHGIFTTGLPGNPNLASRYGSNSPKPVKLTGAAALRFNSTDPGEYRNQAARRQAPIPRPARVVSRIAAPKPRPAPPVVPPVPPTTIQDILAMRQRRAGRK